MGFLGAEKAMYHFELLRGLLHRMFDAQTPPEQMPGKEEEKEHRNLATGEGAVKAFQRRLVLILFGFQMQVKAEHQETLKHQVFEKYRCLNHPVAIESR